MLTDDPPEVVAPTWNVTLAFFLILISCCSSLIVYRSCATFHVKPRAFSNLSQESFGNHICGRVESTKDCIPPLRSWAAGTSEFEKVIDCIPTTRSRFGAAAKFIERSLGVNLDAS